MLAALRETVVLGVVTNRDYLRAVLAHPAFAAGATHTEFLAEHLARLDAAGRDRSAISPPCSPRCALASPARRGARRCAGRDAAPTRGRRSARWRAGARTR